MIERWNYNWGDAKAINHLLRQLSKKLNLITERSLFNADLQKDFFIFIVKDIGRNPPECVGMATIFFKQLLSGWIGEIHDVVVDEAYQNHHLGSALLKELLATAQWKSDKVDSQIKISLTSKPDRERANAMYLQYGFELVAKAIVNEKTGKVTGTNLYIKTITP